MKKGCTKVPFSRCAWCVTPHNPMAKEFPKTCDTRFGLPTRELPPGLSEEALKDVDEGDSEEIDKDLETVAGKIWDWLEDVENQCDEGPSFDEDANAEEVADWLEKWTGVRAHIASTQNFVAAVS